MPAMAMRRIVAARNRAGWSQAELARRAGVRKETIHRIEAGKNNPDESTFIKIEKAFKTGGVSNLRRLHFLHRRLGVRVPQLRGLHQ